MHRVVLWLVVPDSAVPGTDDWLAPGEIERLRAMRFAKRRSDWRRGRWVAKQAIRAFLGDGSHRTDAGGGATGGSATSRTVPPGEALPAWPEIEVRTAHDGAPEPFVAARRLPLTISISHGSDLAMCAVAAGDLALGCDLEAIEPRSDRFVADYFTAPERAAVAAAPHPSRPLLINLIWSAKESALKALRCGLRADTRSVAVDLLEGKQWLESDEPHHEVAAWSPLAILRATGRRDAAGAIPRACLVGWWRQDGDVVATVVCDPLTASGRSAEISLRTTRQPNSASRRRDSITHLTRRATPAARAPCGSAPRPAFPWSRR